MSTFTSSHRDTSSVAVDTCIGVVEQKLRTGKVEVVGVLGGKVSPLDEQPQVIGDAIAYAKWAAKDWDRVEMRLDGWCVDVVA